MLHVKHNRYFSKNRYISKWRPFDPFRVTENMASEKSLEKRNHFSPIMAEEREGHRVRLERVLQTHIPPGTAARFFRQRYEVVTKVASLHVKVGAGQSVVVKFAHPDNPSATMTQSEFDVYAVAKYYNHRGAPNPKNNGNPFYDIELYDIEAKIWRRINMIVPVVVCNLKPIQTEEWLRIAEGGCIPTACKTTLKRTRDDTPVNHAPKRRATSNGATITLPALIFSPILKSDSSDSDEESESGESGESSGSDESDESDEEGEQQEVADSSGGDESEEEPGGGEKQEVAEIVEIADAPPITIPFSPPMGFYTNGGMASPPPFPTFSPVFGGDAALFGGEAYFSLDGSLPGFTHMQ